MHIITGMLISFLFSKKKDSKLPGLLQLRWPIVTKHLLPGRVRFQIPLLVAQEKAVSDLTKQLKKIDGITKVHCNHISGSVLIHFDEKKLQADLLFTVLIKLLGLESELERTPEPGLKKEISKISKGINAAIYSKSNGLLDLKTIVPVSFGLIGLYRLFAVRPLSMPTAITMIWWGYNALIQSNKQDNKV